MDDFRNYNNSQPSSLKEIISSANIKLMSSDFDGALEDFFKALQINKNIKPIFLLTYFVLSKVKITSENKQLIREIIYFFLKSNEVLHGSIFHKALKTSKYSIYENKFNFKYDKKFIDVLDDEVFQLILKKCLLKCFELEKFLILVRKRFLDFYFHQPKLISKHSNFLISLAVQCFYNEYIFSVSNEENLLIRRIEEKLKDQVDESSLIILSLYKPIHHLNSFKSFIARKRKLSDEFENYKKLTFDNEKTEKYLLKDIVKHSNINNTTSKKVKSQYEDNPYPRWINTNIPMKQELLNFLKDTMCNVPLNFIKNFNNNSLNILIAGCGTGMQNIKYSGIINANIIAIDLSARSLSYAKRKTDELGINNIKYLQSDILNTKDLNKSFDIIISTGVLHHMEKPMDGIKSLLNVLKKHGILFLGLYSDYARKDITDTRQMIGKDNSNLSDKDIINYRNKFKDSNNPKLQRVSKLADSFCVSGFRDLIFNVKEHNYNLIQIKEIIEIFNLNFLGFDKNAHQLLINNFKKEYPLNNSEYDLKLWNDFESLKPDSFISMYNFWLTKG